MMHPTAKYDWLKIQLDEGKPAPGWTPPRGLRGSRPTLGPNHYNPLCRWPGWWETDSWLCVAFTHRSAKAVWCLLRVVFNRFTVESAVFNA